MVIPFAREAWYTTCLGEDDDAGSCLDFHAHVFSSSCVKEDDYDADTMGHRTGSSFKVDAIRLTWTMLCSIGLVSILAKVG